MSFINMLLAYDAIFNNSMWHCASHCIIICDKISHILTCNYWQIKFIRQCLIDYYEHLLRFEGKWDKILCKEWKRWIEGQWGSHKRKTKKYKGIFKTYDTGGIQTFSMVKHCKIKSLSHFLKSDEGIL